ncbi:uncharacterized protein LOC119085589 [Bradysia coprophila]|uniref:uncharacterized protein LOC119085589 n=1 Tax=Bradysia coprophila TaxID=38358 RepID=UPI00187DC6E1|nr:uncharacterized protein LOC119085589 [Bradysia coprophila]
MDFNIPRNVIVIGQRNDISDGLIEIAINLADDGKTVWYLASKPVDKLPDIFLRQDRDTLKRIIFTYCKSLEALNQKLMNLDNTSNVNASLIIVEPLHTFFPDSVARNSDHFLQAHAKTLAILQSCVCSLNGRPNGSCWSIASLDDSVGYSGECVATLIDLFYYKKNCVRAADTSIVRWFEDFRIKFC